MCTISYLPVGDRHYILTQNRDESPRRPAPLFPVTEGKGSARIVFAKDPVGGGTWMASGQDGKAVGLMNGGFEPHIPSPPYKHSRGLVVTGFHRFNGVKDFMERFNMFGLEPFTLVIRNEAGLHQIVWTGDRSEYFALDPLSPHLFMSNQLYSKPVQEDRKKVWKVFLENNPSPSPSDLWELHRSKNFILDRPEVGTTGTSQCIFLPEEKKFLYAGIESNITKNTDLQ